MTDVRDMADAEYQMAKTRAHNHNCRVRWRGGSYEVYDQGGRMKLLRTSGEVWDWLEGNAPDGTAD